MTDTTNVGTNVKRDAELANQHGDSHERRQHDSKEGNIEHVTEKGLPPGVEAEDLFNPNGKRPRGVPNGDNS